MKKITVPQIYLAHPAQRPKQKTFRVLSPYRLTEDEALLEQAQKTADHL